MEEKELIRLAQQGNGEAFGQLVERYKTKVFSLAYGLTRDRATADDLAQEILIKAYYVLPKFKFRSEFGTWLFRVAVNHIKDYLRKTQRRRQDVPLQNVPEKEVATEGRSYEEEQEEAERRTLVWGALRRLPQKFLVILTLRDIQGLSYEEIARVLSISLGTVDSRLFRARKMLRERLTENIEGKGGRNEL
ncbi:MAG: sigma-70 family RNA polymerase sigma factor [Clostridiales bacterium]|nr:sigma-70 family RNA polymerase sigma factor [Clostridiales bacterium]